MIPPHAQFVFVSAVRHPKISDRRGWFFGVAATHAFFIDIVPKHQKLAGARQS
jgi:hypothetical protein